MYRYSVDNAVTYTSEDVVLFREAPFACWMERLSLENPDHGIPPDVGSQLPANTMERQDDIAETLRAEGKLVSLIDWDEDESRRRAATLDAMRQGADFIVNGQLALGPLSGSANLLMRTSGYSELGDFLYIPCDTQAKTSLHSAFRLCFLADLLHSLQGQLPPQMLVIRGGDDLVPLQTDDHIYHYRAVKLRFMAAMSNFRKHKMPDPAESSHFGRWSDCAHEVLKQRMLNEDQQESALAQALAQGGEASTGMPRQFSEPMLQAVGAAIEPGYDLQDNNRPPQTAPAAASATLSAQAEQLRCAPTREYSGSAPAGPTLAEQASLLAPDSFRAGPGNSRFRTVAPVAADAAPAESSAAGATLSSQPQPEHNRRASDEALQNLEFIGSSRQPPVIGASTLPEDQPEQQSSSAFSSAPSPSLRDPRLGVTPQPEVALAAAPDPVLDKFADFAELMSVEAALKEPGVNPARASGTTGPDTADRSSVDMDSDHLVSRDPVMRDPVLRDPVLRDPASPSPALPTGYAAYYPERGTTDPANSYRSGKPYPGEATSDTVDSDDKLASRPVVRERSAKDDWEPKATDVFSDSLMTSDNYDD
jgi:hypothetical protein